MAFCQIHRIVYQPVSEQYGVVQCPRCAQLGICYTECEIDKITRVVESLDQYGFQLLPSNQGSFARLVFKYPEEPSEPVQSKRTAGDGSDLPGIAE